MLEKKLKATQTQVELLSGQKENLASETENLNKRLKEREEVITSFVAEKEKNVTEIDNLKRQLKAAEKKMAALKQSHQINGHSDYALAQIADGTDLHVREDLAKKVKRIEELEHENAANQDYLQKVENFLNTLDQMQQLKCCHTLSYCSLKCDGEKKFPQIIFPILGGC